LVEDQYISIRAFYYENTDVFHTMEKMNRAVSTVAAILCVPRICLRIVPAAKGLVAGMIAFVTTDNGGFIDCRNSAQLITSSCMPVPLNCLVPRVIIVCEKETVFYTLYSQRVWEHLGAIIISGKGVPDVATIRFLRMLKIIFPCVPTYAIVDCNPHGIVILNCYKYGASSSIGIELEKQCLADTSIRWIGLHTQDAQMVSQRLVKNLTSRDSAMLKTFLEDRNSRITLQAFSEIERMSAWGKKADIEAVYTIIGRKSFSEWLVTRILQNKWID